MRQSSDSPLTHKEPEKDQPVNVLMMAVNSTNYGKLENSKSAGQIDANAIQEDVQGEHGGDASDQDEEKLN